MKSNVRSLHKKDLNELGQFDLKTGSARVRLVFASPEMAQDGRLGKSLMDLPPDVVVMGCSTAGEIAGGDVRDGSISVADLVFTGTTVKWAGEPIARAEDSATVGRKLAEKLREPSLKGVIILSDGLNVNGSQLLEGLSSILDKSVVVTGGLAADGANFKSTWVLVDRAPRSGFVTAIGMYGEKVRIRHGSQGGWDIFGPERVITKSKDNILYEIDGQPALDLYKKYLGAKAADLPASALLFPIKIWQPGDERNAVVRTILGVNESDHSMTFAGNIPQGYSAQLMRANFDRLIEGAANAAVSVDATSPGLSLAVSCVGRKLLLGERTEEEVQATLERLPKGASQIGFYSYGEISPLTKGDRCHLHNQTMTLTYLTEEDADRDVA